MTIKDDIATEVEGIFKGQWTTRPGEVVPLPKDVGLESNDGVEFESVVVLYADLAESTNMVNTKKPKFAAEVYRGFLAAAARVIRSEGGNITAYDGDRVMAVFIGERARSRAATCALKINYAVKKIVTPMLQKHWSGSTYEVKHVVGVDESPMLVARTGVRGGNDLVWVGRAANYAAKLSAINDPPYTSWITDRVFNKLAEDAKFGGEPKRLMWEERTWTKMDGIKVYRSNWTWTP